MGQAILARFPNLYSPTAAEIRKANEWAARQKTTSQPADPLATGPNG